MGRCSTRRGWPLAPEAPVRKHRWEWGGQRRVSQGARPAASTPHEAPSPLVAPAGGLCPQNPSYSYRLRIWPQAAMPKERHPVGAGQAEGQHLHELLAVGLGGTASEPF